MLSRSHPKIHEPRVTGVSPVPRTSDSARKLRNTRGMARCSIPNRRWNSSGIGGFQTRSWVS